MLLDETLHRLNAAKNVLAPPWSTPSPRPYSSSFSSFAADFGWTAVSLIAAGSAISDRIGTRVGRRFVPAVLRTLIVTIGTVAIVQSPLK
ncbi:hypothetical protein ACW4TU_00540 [Streptomyces sp. QTS52]